MVSSSGCAFRYSGDRGNAPSPEHRLAQVPGTPAALARETPWSAWNSPGMPACLATVGRAANSTSQEIDRPPVFHVEPNISPSPACRPPAMTVRGALETIRRLRIFGQPSAPRELRCRPRSRSWLPMRHASGPLCLAATTVLFAAMSSAQSPQPVRRPPVREPWRPTVPGKRARQRGRRGARG